MRDDERLLLGVIETFKSQDARRQREEEAQAERQKAAELRSQAFLGHCQSCEGAVERALESLNERFAEYGRSLSVGEPQSSRLPSLTTGVAVSLVGPEGKMRVADISFGTVSEPIVRITRTSDQTVLQTRQGLMDASEIKVLLLLALKGDEDDIGHDAL